MKIKDLETQLPALCEEDREKLLLAVARMLSPISRRAILQFQEAWDYKRPFEEFRKSQDELFINMLKIELSPLGIDVRSNIRLKPLDPEEEILT